MYNDHMRLGNADHTVMAPDNYDYYNNSMVSDTNNNDLTFAIALSRLRKWKSITQQELADDINVSKTTISSYESLILHRVPPKALIDTMVDYFDEELKVLNFDLYKLAGLYNVMGTAKQTSIETELKEIKENIADLTLSIQEIQKALYKDN